MRGYDVRRSTAIIAVLIVALFGVSLLSSAGANALPFGGSTPSSAAGHSAAPAAVSSTSGNAAKPSASPTPAASGGPHPGTLDSYLVSPGGATTLDPSLAYYTTDYEPILNVYQSLITFNGTQTGPTPDNWTPELAACTPGSLSCTALFSSSLVGANATTGNPQYYTFVIDGKANFYDPSTQVSWGVYPSDVMFSLARTMMFGNLPYSEFYNGWIQQQWALPFGNSSWDGGIHAPFNNTPYNVMSSMLVNDSTYCPAIATTSALYHGCITFNTAASGNTWPYFLELIGDGLGASITPCGWFTAQDAPVPGFYGSSAAAGDGPCLLPGNATSTSQAAFQTWLTTVSPTYWDATESLASTGTFNFEGKVQFAMVGSGPYYLVPGSSSDSGGPGGSGGYTLKASPAYVQPSWCTGTTGGRNGCEPPAGGYIPTVNQYWENADTAGVQAMIAGTADTASFDISHAPTILQLVNQGKYDLMRNISGGTANWFMAFEENISIAHEQAIDPTNKLNVPVGPYGNSNFLGDNGLRNFLTRAYPYATIQNTVWTQDGIQTTVEYGGAIPPGQASYYPSNISWPYLAGNPDANPADVGGAAWWWAQLTNASSPLYDSQLTMCTTSSPCAWPIVGWVGSPSLDNAISDWITEIVSLSGGRLVPYSYDLTATGSGLYGQIGLGNGQGSLPVYNWGWVADYNDPSDFLLPMWQPSQSFTYAMATQNLLDTPSFNLATCGHGNITWANLSYWANYPNSAIPSSCQGVAYSVMLGWTNIAQFEPNIAQRILDYNMIEHIGNELAFMVYVYVNNANQDYGPWLAPTGINVNPAVGAAAVQTWYTWAYASNVFSATFTESGLPSGTSWSVNFAGTVHSSTTSTITVTGQTNGSYAYAVSYVSGYAASPSNGTVVINGASPSVAVTFSAIGTPTYPLTFTESGLVAGTSWGVTVNNVGAQTSTSPSIVFDLTAGSYDYAASPVIGYTAPAAGSATLASPGGTVALSYVSQSTTTYQLTFQETGLVFTNVTKGLVPSWGVVLNGITYVNTAQWNNFTLLNGSYTFSIVSPPGYTPAASSGIAVVNGADAVVMVPFAAAGQSYALTFTQTGLPTGTSWSVFVDGFGQSSSGSTIAFSLPNGNYNWTTTTIAGWWTSTWSGTATVNGTATSQSIAFQQFTYAVTFFETGVGAGTSWGVLIGGHQYNSTTYNLVVNLPNGTVTYTPVAPSGFIASPATGTVVVSGAPATAVIVFGQEYTVTFTETGLPSGTHWTVYFNGQSYAGTGTTITVSAINGSWTYAVSATNYVGSPSGGSVTVSGANAGVSVSFSSSSTTTTTTGIDSTTGLSTLAYALIGVLALLFVIALVLAIAGRRRPPANPPQTWSGTSTGEGTPPSPPSS